MEQTLERVEQKLTDLENKIDATYRSSERMRKYFLWTIIITVALVALPLFTLPFVIPAFLQSVTIPAGF